MRYAKFSALGIVAATLCCGSALAQQAYQPYLLNEDKVASPKAIDTQQVTFHASETYNSNVAESDAALAASRGLKLSDEITDVGFNTIVIQTLGRQRFFVAGAFDYSWYANNHILDVASVGVSGGDTIGFGQCGLTLGGDFYRGHTDVPELPTVAVSNIRTTGEVGSSIACHRPYGLNPNVAVSERWNLNSSPIYDRADNRVLTVSGGVDFTTPTLGSLGLYGEYDNIHYNDQFVLVQSQLLNSDFYVFTGGLKYGRQFGPNISAQAYLTYTNTSSNQDHANDFNGLTYAFTLYYTVLPKFSANAYVTREVLPSDLPYAAYAVVEDYHLVGTFTASSKFVFQLEGWADNYDYRQTTTVPLPFPGANLSHQAIYQVQGDVWFHFNNFASIEAFVGEKRRTSSFSPFEYWATIVGLKLNAQFGH
jgi:hypothetical protein